jgi:soluble P-type ATPase
MIRIVVPGYMNLSLDHVVLDYNGTLAQDGQLFDSVKKLLNELADQLELHIVTADTFGNAKSNLDKVRCRLTVLSDHDQAEAKQQFICKLGGERTVAIGNGRNDRLMVKEAALGVAVIGSEGTAVETLLASDIVCSNVLEALELLLNPKRLVATLRS